MRTAVAKVLVLALGPGGCVSGAADVDPPKPRPVPVVRSATAAGTGGSGALADRSAGAGTGGTAAGVEARGSARPAGSATLRLVGSETPLPGAGAPFPAPRVGDVVEGRASWYGRKFHGRKTAFGERFDMRALTAATLRFPYNARLRVENLANGRAAEVRVNDRPGNKAGRLLDLSFGAAEALDMIRAGHAPVRVTVLSI